MSQIDIAAVNAACMYFIEHPGNPVDTFNNYIDETGIRLSFEEASRVVEVYEAIANAEKPVVENFKKYIREMFIHEKEN